jgi:hypothetical protein
MQPHPETTTRWGFAVLALVAVALPASASQAPQSPSPQDSLPRTSLVPPPPAPEEVTMLQLADGQVRFGRIDGHDAVELQFTLLGTGGAVRVPWTMLAPKQSLELRTRFGYVDTAAEEIFVEAERLVLTSGATVEGVITSREGSSFYIKTEGNLQSIPKSRVATVEKGLRVPVLDVYSAEELYNQYLAELAPDEAREHVELAERCERFYDFQHAIEHYRKALALDPTFGGEELANRLPRIEAKALQQAQIEYLREADRLRKRDQWDKSLEALRAFEGLFPDSQLAEDAKKQEVRLLKARDEAAKEFVKKRWFHWMRRLTRDKASENTFAAARAYADEQLSDDIQKKVLEDLRHSISKEAEPEAVRTLFAARKKLRYESTTYGNSTWLLGEDAALKGADEGAEPANKGPVNATDAARQQIEERMRKFLQNQRVAARGNRGAQEEDEEQAAWEAMSTEKRAMWLLAYYAEHSGDLEVRVRPDLQTCTTCGGKGALEVLLTGGGAPADSQGGGRSGSSAGSGSQLQECPTCHGIGRVRRVHYR